MPESIDLTDDLLALLGWFAAEGFASTRPGKGAFVSLSLHEDEMAVAERFTRYLGGFGIRCSVYHKRGSRGIEWRAYSHELASWFGAEFGHGASNKAFPEWVMGLSSAQLRIVFDAYRSGDGHERNMPSGSSRRAEWVTTSTALAHQVALMAVKLGYRSSIRWYRDSSSGHYRGDCALTDTSSGQMVWRQVRSTNTRFATRDERVWDLTVEHDESYVVGLAAVHNCWRIGQDKHVQITTMIAEGTLDDRIQEILKRKSKVIGEVTGDIDDVSVMDSTGGVSPSDIIIGLVNEALDKWKPAAAAVG